MRGGLCATPSATKLPIMNLLRKCPSCGRRFVVTHSDKVLVERDTGVEKVVHNVISSRGGYGREQTSLSQRLKTFPLNMTPSRSHTNAGTATTDGRRLRWLQIAIGPRLHSPPKVELPIEPPKQWNRSRTSQQRPRVVHCSVGLIAPLPR